MSNRLQTRITLAFAAVFLTINLSPLEAKADPEGLLLPSRCGPNSTSQVVPLSRKQHPTIFESGHVVKIVLAPDASGVERRAGYELEIKALRPPSQGAFESAIIYLKVAPGANTSASPDNFVANFHFKKGGLVSRTFRQLGLAQLTPGQWQNVRVTSASFGSNDLLYRLVVFARNSENSAVDAQLGKVNVVHKNQGAIDSNDRGSDGRIFTERTGDCDDLDLL